MRNMERNKQFFYYSLYDSKTPAKDEYGNQTGEVNRKYTVPQRMKANISSALGTAQTEQFGTFVKYDKVIITDDLTCPIDENSILFVDVPPSYDNDGNPIYDYIVKRVAKSLNGIAYAISKVSVS